uniref:Uncharacterized protein n=1 Tax=Solanum tuberosum TaxID=4113 RepID=M1C4V2_SOLTU
MSHHIFFLCIRYQSVTDANNLYTCLTCRRINCSFITEFLILTETSEEKTAKKWIMALFDILNRGCTKCVKDKKSSVNYREHHIILVLTNTLAGLTS